MARLGISANDKSVCQKTQHTDDGEQNDDHVGEPAAPVTAEAGLDPFGARQHVRPAQPGRKVHSEEDLVEDRPEPRNPDALQAVDEAQGYQPHGAGYVEHPGGIGEPEHVPGQCFASLVVTRQVLAGAPLEIQADGDGRQQVKADNQQVDCLQLHCLFHHPPASLVARLFLCRKQPGNRDS